jgi:hypothetical protein
MFAPVCRLLLHVPQPDTQVAKVHALYMCPVRHDAALYVFELRVAGLAKPGLLRMWLYHVRPPCVIYITLEFSIRLDAESIIPRRAVFVKPTNVQALLDATTIYFAKYRVDV